MDAQNEEIRSEISDALQAFVLLNDNDLAKTNPLWIELFRMAVKDARDALAHAKAKGFIPDEKGQS